MKFSSMDLGNRKEGEVVRFELEGKSANVRIMTRLNFNNYRYGKEHDFIGGFVKESPVEIMIPKDGHWFATVDQGGYKGNINAAISVHEDDSIRIYKKKEK